MKSTIITVLVLLLICLPAGAQETPECEPTTLASVYNEQLAATQSLDEIAAVQSQLALDIARCRGLGSADGSTRSAPLPAGETAQMTSEYAFKVRSYENITQLLLDNSFDVPEGKQYIVLDFTYYCTRPTDESCEYYAHEVDLIGASGNVYEYELVAADNYEIIQELFGGGEKDIFIIYVVDDADAENFVVRVEAVDDDYNSATRYFEHGEHVDLDH